MAKNILFAYESKAGSTAEVAEFIGKEFCQAGANVDVVHINAVTTLDKYDAVCIGSGVRAGKWLAHGFVKKHKEQLKKVPVAYFLLCMTLKKDTPKTRAKVAKYLKPTREIIPPVSEGHFAGKMDYSKLDWFSRFLLKYILVTPEGDFRNWESIKQWTQELYPKLLHR